MGLVDFQVDISVTENGRKSPTWTLEGDVGSGAASLEELLAFTKLSLIEISKEALKEEQAKGFDKEPIVEVDGRKGKPIQQVSPFGKIHFITRQDVADVLEDIYRFIFRRSPAVTGLYLKSNFVFHNGKAIAFNFQELARYLNGSPKITVGDTFQFVNVMPYAGKLERRGISRSGTNGRQKTRVVKSRDRRGRSGPTINAANGAYFLASRAAVNKYKSNAQIRFEFIPGSTLGIDSYPATNPRTGKPMRRTFHEKNKSHKGPYVYPSIRLVVQEGGVF